MKILGIGNAIVDVICKIEEDFLTKNNLIKSTMKLVDEKEFRLLLSNLTIERTIAGGSVANSIVGLSQLENEVSFIGKVNDDKLGGEYEKSLTDEKVKYCYNKKKRKYSYWNLFNFNYSGLRKNNVYISRYSRKNFS